MKPLAPLHDKERSSSDTRDEAADDGYPLAALEDLLSSCESQTEWRSRADTAHAYYDMGKQMTAEKEAKIRREWGIEPRQINLIHGVINGVLGQEAKARTEKRLLADDDDFDEVAEALNAKYHEAQREANVDMVTSEAYADMVKGGIGWVEVSRSTDPLDYQYRLRAISRRDIWWDMQPGQDKALEDCRWQLRKRWVDLDETIAWMPQHREILESAVNGWDILALPEDQDTYLSRAVNRERTTRIHRDEWIDGRRRRIKLYEVWYRVPAEAVVIEMGGGRSVLFDEANPLHVQAVSRGMFPVRKAITRQVRMALFAGPHRLMDVATRRRRFPYIPFFAFRDDEDGSPYGLIEGMSAPQDDFNDRRQMVNWMLQARQLLIDDDALAQKFNTIEDITATMMRPDFVAVLNSNRKNANAIKIGNDLQLQREQFELMQDSKQLIQDVPRVYSSMLGSSPSGVTSGIANSLLIEQGMVAMGELNDNHRFAIKLVHEELMQLIVDDHLEENMRVRVGQGQQRRVIVLNAWGQEGEPVNRVKDAPIRVGIGDVPTSPALRQQEQQQLSSIIQGLANMPQAMAVLAPAFIEGSSLANRKEHADDLRRALGVPTAGDKRQMQQATAQQAELAKRSAQLQEAGAQAEIAKKAADARLSQAKAEQILVQSDLAVRQQGLQEMQAMQPSEDELINAAIAEALGGQPGGQMQPQPMEQQPEMAAPM